MMCGSRWEPWIISNLVSNNDKHIYNLNKIIIKNFFCFLKTVFVNKISPNSQIKNSW